VVGTVVQYLEALVQTRRSQVRFPASEVGYTSAITGRETTKSIRDMWWHWIKKKSLEISGISYPVLL
jgi:hypothetical protein